MGAICQNFEKMHLFRRMFFQSLKEEKTTIKKSLPALESMKEFRIGKFFCKRCREKEQQTSFMKNLRKTNPLNP
jgi:hypothetical protein